MYQRSVRKIRIKSPNDILDFLAPLDLAARRVYHLHAAFIPAQFINERPRERRNVAIVMLAAKHGIETLSRQQALIPPKRPVLVSADIERTCRNDGS
jgi:hypothetical protein